MRDGQQAALAQDRHLVEQALGEIEVVGGGNHDGALVAKPAQPRHQRVARGVVEPRERFVEQQEPRAVQQRALERQALPHPAGEPGDRVAGAVCEARLPERALHARRRVVEAVEPREEREVFAGGEFGIEVEVVAEQAQAAPQARPGRAGVHSAVA